MGRHGSGARRTAGMVLRGAGRTAAAVVAALVTLVVMRLVQVPVPRLVPVFRPAQVSWSPCQDEFVCATVQVPLDHRNPRGEKISLSLIRLPASDPGQRIGSLFMNPGGPGGSGVDLVRRVGQSLSTQVRTRFDIVGFDPRGIMRSAPLRCFPTFEEAQSTRPPFAFPVTVEEEKALYESDKVLAEACREHGGQILNHMSTADVARDLDLLRQALGDKTLTYLGLSYGTFLGETYASLFPQRVRAMVLDGAIDPIAWTTGEGDQAKTQPQASRMRSDDSSRRTLDEFFRLCDEAGSACALSGRSRQAYDALMEQLHQHPITVGEAKGAFALDYVYLTSLLFYALYAPAVWPEMAGFLAALIRGSPQERADAFGLVSRALGLGRKSELVYPSSVEGSRAVVCADSTNPRSLANFSQDAASAELRFGSFARLNSWYSSACLSWPASAGKDSYPGPFNGRTPSPVLLIGTYFDPATPYQGAVNAARLLPNSRLLSYAGWGHTVFLSANHCVADRVTTYLVSLEVPADGTTCQPERLPFEST